MSFKTFVYSLLLIFVSSSIFAQNIDPDYKDGWIYLKIKDNDNKVFRDLDEVNSNPKFRGIADIFEKYGVNHASRPFIRLNTPVFDRTYKISFAEPSRVHDIIKDLASLDYVEYAERVELLRPTLTPNDPSIANQYHLTNIQAYAAWDIHTGGNAVVAIVDDAVRVTHNDLAPNIWQNSGEIANNGVDDDGNGYVDDYNGFDVADNDSDPNPPNTASDFSFSHGTHCAGIASGATNNGIGGASIGFDNKIMAVKCTSNGGNPQLIENGYEGVTYATVAGADVISMSWGGPGSSQTAQNILTNAHNLGITLVAASGNDNVTTQFYPAAYNFVISVASSTQSDEKSSFSNYGSWIDITAPGSSILSTVATSNSSYQYYDGTSMACPMVAGLCGLLKSYDNALTPDEIEGCITQSADNIDAQNPSYVGQLGAGRINALVSLQCSNPTNPPVSKFTSDRLEENCPGVTIQFTDISIYSPDTWSWSFPGGSPSSSNLQNPVVTYANNGTYDVTLTTTNQYGSHTATEVGYIVIGQDGVEEFFLEDFTNGLSSWTIDNPDNGTTWSIWTAGGTEGSPEVAGIDNYNYNASGQRDGIVSPVLDFSGRTNIVLDFDYAHRRYSADYADSLVVYISSNGGSTYSRIYANAEDGTGSFATNYTTTNQFIPAAVGDWCFSSQVVSACPSIDLSAYDGLPNIVLKFENVNDYGNNLYLDNISLRSSCYVPPGPPMADFSFDVTEGCTGTTVQYTDLSYGNPNVNTWSWSFPGGTPSTSTSPNPTVVYNTEGTFNATLTVNNGSGSDAKTISNAVTINNSQIYSFYLEDFEDNGEDWTIENPDGNTTWAIYTVGGTNSGTKAAGIDNYNYNAPGEIDAIISPVIDFTGKVNVTLDFDYAHRRYSADYADALNVYISTNGGSTYTAIYQNSENGTGNFATNGFITSQFLPNTIDDWCYGGTLGATCPTIDLSAYDGMSNIVLKFENVNDYGNNTYIDNIRLKTSCDVTVTAPVADFSITPNSGCSPLTVSATDLSTNSPTTWAWSVSGPETYNSTTQNPTFTLGTAGTYTISLVASNAAGSDTHSETVIVNPDPTANFTYAISGNTLNFTNTSTNAISYSWNFGDGNNDTATNPSHTFAVAGTYTVVLTTTNACGTDTHTETITIGLAPAAAFTADATSGCTPLNVQFTDISTNNPTTWAWTFSGPVTLNSNVQHPNMAFTVLGTYDVTLTVSNALGSNSTTQTAYITVNDIPTAGFTYAISGNTLNFTNTSTDATSYSWGFGDGNNDTASNPSHTFSEAGTYTIVLTATNECGSDSYTETVSVGGAPNPAFSSDITSGCTPLNVQFTDISTNNPTTWAWTFSGPVTLNSNVQHPNMTFAVPGTYDVTLTVGNALGNNSTTQTAYITVSDVPTANFTYTTMGNTLNFTNTSIDATSYSWNFGDGNNDTVDNPSHTFGTAGIYTVVLTTTNACGSDTRTESITIGGNPVAAFTANATSGCTPLNVQFTDMSTNSPAAWSWTFSGPTTLTSNVQHPNMTFTISGTYDVALTVSNVFGNDFIIQSGYIVISDVPNAGFTYTITGNTVDFTNTSTDATSYSWNFGNGNTDVASNPSYTFDEVGTYTVVLTATNECGSNAHAETISVGGAPSPAFSSDITTGCTPLNVQFTDMSTGNPMAWAWTFSGPATLSSNDQNPNVTFTVPGTYDVSLTASNAIGSNTITQNGFITVGELPSAGFTSSISGNTISFTNSTLGADTYSWDFGDGNTDTGANPNHSYANAGTYTVVLTVTNSCGTDTATETVTIGNVPSAAFTSSGMEGCAPYSVSFTDMSTNNPTSWAWTVDGAGDFSSTDQNPTFVFTEAGTYNITLIATNALGSDTAYEENFITVNEEPTAGFSYNESDGTVTFNDSSIGAASYAWDFGDGNTDTSMNPIHTYTNSDIYTVTLTVTNECGSDTFTETIDVIILNSHNIIAIEQWSIFPNPNTGIFNISIEGNKNLDLEIEVINLLGQTLYTQNAFVNSNNQIIPIRVEHLAVGTYFIRLLNDGKYETKRFIVNK